MASGPSAKPACGSFVVPLSILLPHRCTQTLPVLSISLSSFHFSSPCPLRGGACPSLGWSAWSRKFVQGHQRQKGKGSKGVLWLIRCLLLPCTAPQPHHCIHPSLQVPVPTGLCLSLLFAAFTVAAAIVSRWCPTDHF